MYIYIFGTSLEMTSSPILVDCSKRFTVLTLYTACMFPPCNAHGGFTAKITEQFLDIFSTLCQGLALWWTCCVAGNL